MFKLSGNVMCLQIIFGWEQKKQLALFVWCKQANPLGRNCLTLQIMRTLVLKQKQSSQVSCHIIFYLPLWEGYNTANTQVVPFLPPATQEEVSNMFLRPIGNYLHYHNQVERVQPFKGGTAQLMGVRGSVLIPVATSPACLQSPWVAQVSCCSANRHGDEVSQPTFTV